MTTTKKTKEQIVDELLENGTYMPDSGLIRMLKAKLIRVLSRDDLASLALVVDLKETDR